MIGASLIGTSLYVAAALCVTVAAVIASHETVGADLAEEEPDTVAAQPREPQRATSR